MTPPPMWPFSIVAVLAYRHPVRTYRRWHKEVRKREGTGCSMSGARIFLCTYVDEAASETNTRSCEISV